MRASDLRTPIPARWKDGRMTRFRLVRHAPGAPGLRWLGLGPGLRPSRGLLKLQRLFNKHAFWARQRSSGDLRRMLAGSPVVVSLWRGKRLVGFGRATSDGFSRAAVSYTHLTLPTMDSV